MNGSRHGLQQAWAIVYEQNEPTFNEQWEGRSGAGGPADGSRTAKKFQYEHEI